MVISIFTVSGNSVSNVWPSPNGFWALSNHDADTTHNANWQLDCEGNTVRTEPYYTQARVNTALSADAPPSKGFVAVEFYYCYEQALNIPVMSQFLPNPMRIHAYTLMPLPAAQPTPTPDN